MKLGLHLWKFMGKSGLQRRKRPYYKVVTPEKEADPSLEWEGEGNVKPGSAVKSLNSVKDPHMAC